MFSIPTVYASTPLDRNTVRFEKIDEKLGEAERSLVAALEGLRAQREAFREVPEGFDLRFNLGEAQNMAHSGGRAVEQVIRPMQKAQESLLEAAVLCAGFEVVQ